MALDPITGAMELIGNIGGWINDGLKQKREIAAAAAENTIRLLKDEQSNNSAWEMATLQDKDKWLRWASFCLFTFPMVWAVFDPVGAANYFNVTLAALPDWYKQVYLGITGGIWGISALKNAVPSIVSQMVTAFIKKG